MAQTFVRMLVHLVFSSKHSKDLILPDIEASLHAYMTGTLKNLGCPCLRYIRKQKEKHRKMTFEDEFLQLLKKHRMPYDPRYIWD